MIWCVEDDSSIRDMEVYVLSSTGFEDGGSFLQINKHRRGNASGFQGKLEAHEYRNALKSGELHEFAPFCERFVRYKAQYTFPKEQCVIESCQFMLTAFSVHADSFLCMSKNCYVIPKRSAHYDSLRGAFGGCSLYAPCGSRGMGIP